MMYSKHGRVKTPAGAGAEALETMLEKIMEDCMGGSLYNALDVTMGQGTFGIQFDLNAPTSTFDLSTITLNGYESNALFHEMFHIYQAYQETPQSYVDAAANLEVVAAIAQYRYLKRLPEFTPGSEWARVYENTNIGQNIVVLSNYLTDRGQLKDPSKSLTFNSLFTGLGMTVQDIYSQRLNQTISFDHNRTVQNNLMDIIKLSFNCG